MCIIIKIKWFTSARVRNCILFNCAKMVKEWINLLSQQLYKYFIRCGVCVFCYKTLIFILRAHLLKEPHKLWFSIKISFNNSSCLLNLYIPLNWINLKFKIEIVCQKKNSEVKREWYDKLEKSECFFFFVSCWLCQVLRAHTNR